MKFHLVVLTVLTFAGLLLADNSCAQTASSAHRPSKFAQLGLTPAQRAQIKQIRQETPQGKQRREDIAAVLTPAQKAQLSQEMTKPQSED